MCTDIQISRNLALCCDFLEFKVQIRAVFLTYEKDVTRAQRETETGTETDRFSISWKPTYRRFFKR
jgi:hypothetical protein